MQKHAVNNLDPRDLKFISKNFIDDEKYSNIMNTTMYTCML